VRLGEARQVAFGEAESLLVRAVEADDDVGEELRALQLVEDAGKRIALQLREQRGQDQVDLADAPEPLELWWGTAGS
jgi:hypothetical protein